MPRRRTYPEVALFPFLSVLCSVIGVLVLFVVLVLGTRIVAVEERYQQTEDYRRQAYAGQTDVVEDGIDQRTLEELEAELDRLAEELRDRREKRDGLLRKLAALEDLIIFKETELFVPAQPAPNREFDKPELIEMVPDQEHEVKLRPIFVEVHHQGYTVHPGEKRFPAIGSANDDSDSEPTADRELEQFLRDLKPRKEYLVFLIHPNGVAAFDDMRLYLTQKHQQIQIGWEPFSRNWLVANEP